MHRIQKSLCLLLFLLLFIGGDLLEAEANSENPSGQKRDDSKIVLLMALNVYVHSAVKQFTYEFGRFPEDLATLERAGLLLKKPYNFFAEREIPLDGSSQEVGDIWLETADDGTFAVCARTPERVLRAKLSDVPRQRLVSPRSEFLNNPHSSLVKQYYSDELHRKLFYQASILVEAYRSSGAQNLEQFRKGAFYPDLNFAKNVLTQENLREDGSPGNFALYEKDGKAYLAWYDEDGSIIPEPRILLGTPDKLDSQEPGKLARIPIPLSY